MTRASRTIEIAISSGSETSRSSHLPIERRQSPIELAAIAPVASTPWRSGSQPIAESSSTTERATRWAYAVASPSTSSAQAIPESASDDGIASRRPKLPSESHARSAGGGPCSATASSINRRTSASTTTDSTPLMRMAARPAACIAISVARSCGTVARRPAASDASAIARRSMIGVWVSFASRSTSVATPISSPPLETTGTCRMPRSIISSISSSPVCSGRTVTTGVVITSPTGVSTGRPAATTRERRSRSVTIPNSPCPASTRIELTPCSSIRAAASRRGTPGSQTTGRLRTSTRTASCPTSRSSVLAVGSPPGRGRSISARATDRSPAGSLSSGITSSAASR